MGSDGGDTGEVRAGGGVAGRNVVVGVAVVLLALVVPWAAAWVVARPGGHSWDLALAVVGCVAVAGAVSGVRRLTHHGVVVGLVVGLVALSSMEALWGYQSGSVLYRRLAPELEQLASAAQNAESGSQECEPLPILRTPR